MLTVAVSRAWVSPSGMVSVDGDPCGHGPEAQLHRLSPSSSKVSSVASKVKVFEVSPLSKVTLSGTPL